MSIPKAVQWLGDQIGDGLRAVGDVAGDALRSVGKGIQKLGDFAGDTIRAIAKDPLPTLLSYAGTFIGIPPYVTSSVITAAKGGNLEDVAKSAAISYATTSFMSDTQIGADIKNYTTNQWAGDFTDSMMEKFDLSADQAVQISRVASSSLNSSLIGGINAALSGKSIATGISSGFTSGLIYSSTDSYFDSIKKNPNWGLSPVTVDLMKGATSTALNTIVSGKGDPAQAVGNYIAYASLNMAGSSLFNKAKETYQSLAKNTEATEKAQAKYAAEKTEYDKQLKAAEDLRKSVSADTTAYQKTIDEQYNLFKKQYDGLIAANDAQAYAFNKNKQEFERNKFSAENWSSFYDIPQQSYIDAANAAADKANAAAAKSKEIQDAATKLYNDNKPMLDSLPDKAAEIEQKIADFSVIKDDIEIPKDGNLAERLQDASSEYQNKYDLWAAAKSEADKSAEDYTKALAEVATRDATIDAINSGVITATKQDEDGNWVLSNNMVLTKDGKFVQDGVQQFTNAAGINQKPLDLTSDDGSKINFSEDAGRLLSTSDVKNLAQRDYGLSITDEEAGKFAGKDYTEEAIPELESFAATKAQEAGFPDLAKYAEFGGDLDQYQKSKELMESVNLFKDDPSAALRDEIKNSNLSADEKRSLYEAMGDVQSAQALPKVTTDAGSVGQVRIGAPFAANDPKIAPILAKNPALRQSYNEYANTFGISSSATIDQYIQNLKDAADEFGLSPDSSTTYEQELADIVNKDPSKRALVPDKYLPYDMRELLPLEKVEQAPDEVVSVDAGSSEDVVKDEEAADSGYKPISFDNTATILAINANGTALVQNDTTGSQNTVQTIGDATVGAKVDLVVSDLTGETTAVSQTGTSEAANTTGASTSAASDTAATGTADGAITDVAGATGAATGTVLATNNNGISLVQDDTTGTQLIVQTIGDVGVGSKVDLNVSTENGETIAVAKTETSETTGATTGATTSAATDVTGTTGTTTGATDTTTGTTGTETGTTAGTTIGTTTGTGTTVADTGTTTGATGTIGATTGVTGETTGTTGATTDTTGATTDTTGGTTETTGATTGTTTGTTTENTGTTGTTVTAGDTTGATTGTTGSNTGTATGTTTGMTGDTTGTTTGDTTGATAGTTAATGATEVDAVTKAINDAIAGIKFPAGITSDEVAEQVRAAMAANPSLSATDVTNAIAAYMTANPGLTALDVNTAITSATKDLATKKDVEAAIAGIQFPAGITSADVAEQIKAAMEANPNLKIADVTKAITDYMSANPALTAVDVNTAITGATKNLATQSQLDDAVKNLSADQKTQFNNLTQAQKDEVDARVKQGQDIQNAIASAQQTTSNQVQNIQGELNGRIDALVKQGVETNAAIQQAIAESQTQINRNDANINSRIDVLVGQGVDYQKATQIAFEETRGTINNVGKQLADKIKADEADKQAAAEAKRVADAAAEEEKKAAAAAALAKDIAAKQAAGRASTQAQQRAAGQGALSLLKPAATSELAAVAGPLAAKYLMAKEDPNKFESPLEKFLKTQNQSLGKENQYGIQPQGNAMNDPSYSYGTQRPIEDILGMGSAQSTQAGQAPDSSIPSYPTAVNYAQGGMAGTRHGKYAQGGLSTPLMASGGKMRVDFRHGDAVTGAGDGQSDDIPAMLADGEFVFPADVVAAIGNGSTKAGSDKLYDMMHGIRAHARSAKPKDLPPQIKSPLDFLKRS